LTSSEDDWQGDLGQFGFAEEMSASYLLALLGYRHRYVSEQAVSVDEENVLLFSYVPS